MIDNQAPVSNAPPSYFSNNEENRIKNNLRPPKPPVTAPSPHQDGLDSTMANDE